MKAISLWQPWASLVSLGIKKIETRSWRTNYRGPLAIHASKRFWREDRQVARDYPAFAEALNDAGFKVADLPLGCVIAVCEIVDCVPTESMSFDLGRAYKEKPFGDYSPGRFAWILDNVRPLKEPIPAKGALGLWEWEMPGGEDY